MFKQNKSVLRYSCLNGFIIQSNSEENLFHDEDYSEPSQSVVKYVCFVLIHTKCINILGRSS